MLTPIADAFLASASFIAHANLLLAQVQGLGAEAPCNKVEGMMHLWQKWRTMRGGRIMWERDGELLEWCMARYCDNLGTEWLAPFTNNFAPAAPSFDEELEALLAEKEPLVVSMAAKGRNFGKKSLRSLRQEALVCEGLGLGGATGAGNGLQQGQEEEEEEEGTKEKTPDTTASAAMGAARKAPAGSAKRLASPTKKGSPTKLASKCRGRPAPRYEAPMQQDFLDKELACLLVPRQVEAVVDMGVEAGVVLKEIKGKVTVDLATCQAFKEERRGGNAISAGQTTTQRGAGTLWVLPHVLDLGAWQHLQLHSGEDIPLGGAGEKGMGSGEEGEGGRGPK
ncbi:hypothetical protein C0993_008641 [Termitomyces sp. T159_Od127]|nr:hypothetical protein C0993_008641 [Termitomyces sp. T159_Od127]